MRTPVTFVSHEASYTGAPLFLLTVLAQADLSSYAPSVLLLHNGPLKKAFRSIGPVQVAARRFPSLSFALCRAKRTRQQLHYINSHAYHFLHDAKKQNFPVVMHVHEGPVSFAMIDEVTKELLRTYPKRFIANSDYVRRHLVSELGIAPGKIDLLYPGIDLKRWSRRDASGSLRTKLGISPDALIVGGAGQIHPRKGTDLWLAMARRIIGSVQDDTQPPVHFVWVGKAAQDQKDFAEELYRLSEDRAFKNRVHWVGERIDPKPYFELFDVFVLSSRQEPLGMVMLENMALKNPVVAFRDAGGPVEVLSRVGGMLVSPLRSDTLADTVTFLLRTPLYRKALGESGRKVVEESFTIESSVRHFERILSECA